VTYIAGYEPIRAAAGNIIGVYACGYLKPELMSPAPAVLQLTHLHGYAILMHMRTTLIIDDALLARAQELTGLQEKTAVLHAGLQALIAREHARRLAALGGTERGLRAVPRRRTRPRA